MKLEKLIKLVRQLNELAQEIMPLIGYITLIALSIKSLIEVLM